MKRKLALLLIATLTAAAIPFSAPALAAGMPSEEAAAEAGEAGLSMPESSDPSPAEEETVPGVSGQDKEDPPVQPEDAGPLAETADSSETDHVPAPADQVLSPEDIPMEAPEPGPGPEEDLSREETVPDESSESQEISEDLEMAELEYAGAGTLPKITAADDISSPGSRNWGQIRKTTPVSSRYEFRAGLGIAVRIISIEHILIHVRCKDHELVTAGTVYFGIVENATEKMCGSLKEIITFGMSVLIINTL